MTTYTSKAAAYLAARYQRKLKTALKDLGGCCKLCGSKTKLEFDHILPNTKKANITALLCGSRSKLEKELAKCQLLCRKCHVKKTATDLGRKIAKGTHGTLSSYRYCKCKLCREAKTKYMRNYMRKKRAENQNYGR